MSVEYCAGFVDGEGCMTISKGGGVTLSIINTSLEALEFVRDTLGVGRITERKQRVNKRQFLFRAYGEDALSALRRMLPFLIEKREQAKVILDYRERPRGRRIPGKRGLHEDTSRVEIIETLRMLKRKESTFDNPLH